MKKWLTKIQHTFGILTKQEDEQTGLFIPNRQVSWVISSIVLFAFLCFILGYFWGHRRALQRFVAKIEEESFADRINYALYTMNDRDISEFEQEQDESEDTNGTNDTDQEEAVESEESLVAAEKQTVEEPVKTSLNEAAKTVEKTSIENNSVPQATTLFVAPLAGFGTLLAATEFTERIKLLDPHATVQKRTSKTQKGRAVTWYQVVTGDYAKKEELQKITSAIQKKEHIKKVEITEKRKG